MTKRIVIGSVLKPVNDARIYEKIAISLSQIPDLTIHVAGYSATAGNPPINIRLHPLFNFPRLGFSRLWAPWKFYKLLLQVKPQLVIITSHELLIVTVLYKILFGGKIIYDVQENYFRNILFGKSFPPIIREILALYVRTKEVLTRPFISHYFLAEKNYEKEFSFSKGKSSILENKAIKPTFSSVHSGRSSKSFRLLYSGTIAESYGIFEAIELAQALHEADPEITLTIVGYSSKRETLTKVKQAIQNLPFIELKGGDELIPHEEILREIGRSDFGLLPYQPNKSTDNCIPTKLYEYLAYRLPVLVRDNPTWTEIIKKYQAGICLNFNLYDPKTILSEMKSSSFYTVLPGDEIYWESEAVKLNEAVKSILSNNNRNG